MAISRLEDRNVLEPIYERARNELVYKSLFNFLFLFSKRVCKVDREPICLLDSGVPLSSTERTVQAGIPTIEDSTCPFVDISSTFFPSTGVLLRRFTLRPPGAFLSTKIEKLRGPAFTMTLSSDEQLNGFSEGSYGKGKRVANVRQTPITENTRETTLNESYSTWS